MALPALAMVMPLHLACHSPCIVTRKGIVTCKGMIKCHAASFPFAKASDILAAEHDSMSCSYEQSRMSILCAIGATSVSLHLSDSGRPSHVADKAPGYDA